MKKIVDFEILFSQANNPKNVFHPLKGHKWNALLMIFFAPTRGISMKSTFFKNLTANHRFFSMKSWNSIKIAASVQCNHEIPSKSVRFFALAIWEQSVFSVFFKCSLLLISVSSSKHNFWITKYFTFASISISNGIWRMRIDQHEFNQDIRLFYDILRLTSEFRNATLLSQIIHSMELRFNVIFNRSF